MGTMCYNRLAKGAWLVWVLFAFGSAVFAGLTAVLAKIGVRDVDSNLATALRTVVVLSPSLCPFPRCILPLSNNSL